MACSIVDCLVSIFSARKKDHEKNTLLARVRFQFCHDAFRAFAQLQGSSTRPRTTRPKVEDCKSGDSRYSRLHLVTQTFIENGANVLEDNPFNVDKSLTSPFWGPNFYLNVH